MKLVSLFIIFFALFYTFRPREEVAQNIDSVKTKLSSLRKSTIEKRSRPVAKVAAPASIVEAEEVDSSMPEVSSHEDDVLADAESSDSIPWNDIEKAWESEVKEALMRLEPEEGETIYSAYIAEKEKHKEEIDSLFSEGRSSERSRAPSVMNTEDGDAIGALDQKHDERLKEILGSHYEEINKRHQEYQESIQHLNRENSDAEIGISL